LFPARKAGVGAAGSQSHSSGDIGPATSKISMLVAILVVTLIGRPAEWIPGLGSIPVTRIVFLIALVVALRSVASLSPARLMSLPGLKSAIFFLGLAVASIVFSIYKSKTLSFIPGPVTLLLSIILLVKAVPTVRDAERVLVAMIVSAIALSIGTLRAYQGGRAEIGTEASSYDPNDLAYVLISILPIAFAMFTVSKGLKKIALLGAIGAMLVTVLLTGSRGGFIALAVVAIMFTFKPIGLAKDGRLKQVAVGGAVARVAALAIAAMLAWVFAPPEIKYRIETMSELGSDYNMNMSDQSSRLLVWQRHSMATVRRPIGYGLGTANTVDGMFGGQYKTTHNTLVQTLVELGFLGLFLLLRCYYVSWRDLQAAERHSKQSQAPPTPEQSRIALYSRALRMSLVGNIISGFFLSQAYGPTLWVLFAVCAAFIYLNRAASGEAGAVQGEVVADAGKRAGRRGLIARRRSSRGAA
jgi:O-antigen ligase